MAVYFARAGSDGPVKIGYVAGDVRRRLTALQAGCPHRLVLLRTCDGDRSTEGWFHRRFASLRIDREWFAFDAEMLTTGAPEDARQKSSRFARTPKKVTESAQIIDALGGTSAVSAACQTSESAVSNWKARNSIPSARWPAVIRLATAQSVPAITLDLLEQRFAGRTEAA
jgi:hypothetical protein